MLLPFFKVLGETSLGLCLSHLLFWCNKIPGCLSNESLFPRAQEAEKSKTKKPGTLVSGEDLSNLKMTAFSPFPYKVERGTRSSITDF